MAFKKGQIPWIKGKHYSEVSKQKMSKSKKENPPVNQFKKGHIVPDYIRQKIRLANLGKVSTFKGKHHTDEAKKRLSTSHIGLKASKETKRKMSLSRMGKHPSEETRKKLSLAKSGIRLTEEQKQHLREINWKGGVKATKRRERAKRLRWGYDALNDEFEGSEGHHIDKDHVVFIPKKLHRSVWHSQDKLDTMERINTLVFIWLLRG